MDALRDALDAIEAREKTIEVHTGNEAVAAEIERQFSTRNVRVTHRELGVRDELGFLCLRDRGDEFRGAIGLDTLDAVLSPEDHPPWTLSDETDVATLFRFLDNTLFTAYDRRQMLATTREIEERAWRVDAGTLYVGFQNAAAFEDQRPVYERFAHDRALSVTIFVDDEWDVSNDDAGRQRLDADETVDVVSDAGDEIGQFWFVLFDGGESHLQACGLIAEERAPGRYYGFWTYDPVLVDDLVSYLRETYVA